MTHGTTLINRRRDTYLPTIQLSDPAPLGGRGGGVGVGGERPVFSVWHLMLYSAGVYQHAPYTKLDKESLSLYAYK